MIKFQKIYIPKIPGEIQMKSVIYLLVLYQWQCPSLTMYYGYVTCYHWGKLSKGLPENSSILATSMSSKPLQYKTIVTKRTWNSSYLWVIKLLVISIFFFLFPNFPNAAMYRCYFYSKLNYIYICGIIYIYIYKVGNNFIYI